MTDPQIAEIAAKLTAAQRAAILAAPFNSMGCGFPPTSLIRISTSGLYVSGYIAPLLERQGRPNYSGDYSLTPLGQSVAAYLKEQSHV
jgi:hypothetical protein